MQHKDEDQEKTFYNHLFRPVIERTFAVIGIVALIYALIDYIFEQNIPTLIRQWSLTLGFVIVLILGISLTIYRYFKQQQEREQGLRNSLLSKPYLYSTDEREELPPNFLDAKEVFLFGITLENILRRHYSTFKLFVDDNRRQIRILLPDLEVLTSAIDRIGLDWGQSHRFQQEIFSSLEWLSDIATKSKNNFEVRLTQYLPTVSILIINPKSENGQIRVSLHLFQGSFENRPYFEIFKKNHPDWFDFYIHHYYEELWKGAKAWETGIEGYVARAKQVVAKKRDEVR